MYYVVKTMEQSGLEAPNQIMIRIHNGTQDGIKHHWDLWNKDNPEQHRYDHILGTGNETMSEAIQALKGELG